MDDFPDLHSTLGNSITHKKENKQEQRIQTKMILVAEMQGSEVRCGLASKMGDEKWLKWGLNDAMHRR